MAARFVMDIGSTLIPLVREAEAINDFKAQAPLRSGDRDLPSSVKLRHDFRWLQCLEEGPSFGCGTAVAPTVKADVDQIDEVGAKTRG